MERWTPERRRELTRTALVEAAAQVFARRGFYGASLDEIAETAGFTRGAIYKNFTDKEGLFLAALDNHNRRALAAFSEWFEEHPADPSADPAQLEHVELASAFRQILARDSDWFALELEGRLYALRNPEFRQRYVANYREIAGAVAGFITDLANSAGFKWKVPAARLAHLFEVSSEGFLAWAFLDPDDGELFRSFFELLVASVVEEP
ncbi:MAG TPA: TetR/AcrR family transcriptional regulator [Acidimicrobiales bacterium]|nr:TetR/AcrR family transcriptional regulator [Acidimicrobiales bacterium]